MNKTQNYFQKNGSQWVNDAYKKDVTIAHGRLDVVSEVIEHLKPNSVLDIGCGDGRFLENLSWVKTRIGIDYSDSMLKLASIDKGDIRYEVIDLNSASSLIKLKNIGKVDVITMMGVIHYLEKPTASLRGLIDCAHNKTNLIISFRNKLFNTNPLSRYYSSDLTKNNFSRLEAENIMWRRIGLVSEDVIGSLKADSKGKELIASIINDGSYEGLTDPEWNPDSFENWRQFTPVESILLLEQAGFRASRIIPIAGSITSEVGNAESVSFNEAIGSCTSYVIVANIM